MVKSLILSDIDIDHILSLPQVIKAKNEIDLISKGSIQFDIELSNHDKQILHSAIGLDLSTVISIPMRWIKGDTLPHIDKGATAFDTTFLAYLTDSTGQLRIDGASYPISKGNAYVFSEGLMHETVGTGMEPRLLLGPMSEHGLKVGGATIITANGQTEIIYIRYDLNTGTTYKINNGSYNSLSLPLTIVNSNISYTLQVLFETDLVLHTNIWYIICGSENIQFGSTYLKSDGTRPVIYIDNTAYDGFIQNGDVSSNGHNNIYVFNIEVRAINSSVLNNDGGWICKPYFGKGVSNNFVVNCSSDGPIIDAGGGIVGGYSGSELGASLYIIGCSSSGATATYSGGIIGFYAGQNVGAVTCENCWSTGLISGANSGGIFGYYAGDNGGVVRAIQCYSLGAISGQYSGGIYGQYAGNNSTAEATKCYSQGAISTNAGGIFGSDAASSSGTTTATNCYASEVPSTPGNGIYSGGITGNRNAPYCYYPASGSWSSTAANSLLQGIPNPPNIVGATWVASGGPNYPYELNNMGYTPYTIQNIIFTGGTPVLKQSYSQPVVAGNQSNAAIRPGYSYDKMKISGGDSGSYGTITVDSNSGIISTTSSTAPGVYTLVIRNTGSYNITTFNLTVSEGSTPTSNICFPAGTLILTDQGNVAIEQINESMHTIRNNKIVGIVKTKTTNDYLVCFEKDSLGKNVPNQRTTISSEHGIMFKGKMRKAKCFLAKFQGVGKVKYNGDTLYNVLMEDHNVMFVNNLVCETLNPKNAMAKLHMHLKKCTPEQEKKIVDKYNECITVEQTKMKKRMNINHYVSI